MIASAPFRTRILFGAPAFAALLLGAPLFASAQAAVTHSGNSGTGATVYDSPNSIGDFQAGDSGRLVSAVVADAMASGPAGYPYYCLSRTNYPQTVQCTNNTAFANGSKYPDGFYVCANGPGNVCGITGPPTTANRLCTIADTADAQSSGFQPDSNVVATYMPIYNIAGNQDENNLTFDGTRWFLSADPDTFYIPGYVGTSQANRGNINEMLSGLTCKSMSLPVQTVAVTGNNYNITAGDPVTLTWSDTAYADNYAPAPASCTTSGFTLSTTAGTPYCDDWENRGLCSAASATLALNNNTCTRYCAHYTTPQVTTLSGSATVYPQQTTTYAYTCTNPNGTTYATATVNVTAANHAPAAPQLWGLYDATAGIYYGASAPAYNANGYYLYANSADPDGDNVNYLIYFYNNQTGAYTPLTPQWSGWTGSGGWNATRDLVNFPPGTYQVGAYAEDSKGAMSAFSGWQTVTLNAVACTSSPNACGQTNPGTIQSGGSCSASTPANPTGYGTTCTSSGANACGTHGTNGTIQCDGSCSSTVPANPAGYGTTCTSAAANACGAHGTNGTIQCNGTCSSTPPANPVNLGQACASAANACGQTNSNGTYQCDGTCSSTVPANPAYLNQPCALTSSANACGQTTSANTGTYNCSDVCVGTPPAPPSNNACPADLTPQNISASPSSTSVGQPVTLSSLIKNIGSGPAGSFPNIFRINTSTLISGSTIAGLAAGASANTTASYTPASATTYTVSACADNNTNWQGSVGESNENNNCSGDTSFTAVPCAALFTSSPSITIDQGQTATLTWGPSSTYCGFTGCTFSDGHAGGASGSYGVSPMTTSTYALSCVGPYNPSPGTVPVQTTVTVRTPTIVNFSAAPTRVGIGKQTTVSWNAQNVQSCTITKNGALPAWQTLAADAGNNVNSSAPDTVTTQVTYKFDCVNGGGTHATATVVVNTVPVFQEF